MNPEAFTLGGWRGEVGERVVGGRRESGWAVVMRLTDGERVWRKDTKLVIRLPLVTFKSEVSRKALDVKKPDFMGEELFL